jgi:hypothetical protein
MNWSAEHQGRKQVKSHIFTRRFCHIFNRR